VSEEFQALIEGIFIGGESTVNTIVSKEQAKVIIDLRAEAQESAVKGNVEWVHIPLVDGKPNQSTLLWDAIQHVVKAHEEGKKVVIH
jgi:protein-tyrosine phosphatase